MRQHGAASVVVTTPAGQLMGIVERQDIERCLAPAVQPHQGRYRLEHGTPSVEIGYKLSCEEHSPSALVCYAKQAEEAGFTFAMLSDHYHPWIAEQGQSPFVWSVIGSIAQATERLRIGTGVTCPLIRMHPAIVAQAAATAAALLPGRFMLGVGTERTSTNTSSATTGRQGRHGVPCWRRPWPSSAPLARGPAEPSRPILYCRERPTVYPAGAAPPSTDCSERDALGPYGRPSRRRLDHGGESTPSWLTASSPQAVLGNRATLNSMSVGPLKKQRRDAWHRRGGPSPACRARFFQTSDSRPILRKLPAPSLRRQSHRRSSAVPIPHVTLRPSRRQPRQGIRTSGSTRSGQTRRVFSSSTPARSCPSSINN